MKGKENLEISCISYISLTRNLATCLYLTTREGYSIYILVNGSVSDKKIQEYY
jgi:hypothetical protein